MAIDMADKDKMATSASGSGPLATSPVKKGHKRRRTRSHNSSSPSPGRGFFVPGFDNNPSSSGGFKMMSLNELMDAAHGVSNMYLAHEIAVDKDFMLEKLKPEESEMEIQVKKIVHQAFWDVLKMELSEDPPLFNRALSLLEDVRTALVGLLLPSQHRIKDGIMERLDLDLIAQQASNGVLDVFSYSTYVLDLMSKLCAPVRDEEIGALRQIKDVVPLFQGIMKTMEHMKLDMANFMVQQARPIIVSQSVEYEKIKFKEFLQTQVDGLELTRSWLKRHKPTDDESANDPRYKKLVVNRILNDAFVELLEWDDYFALPETLAMDAKRIVALRDAVERMAVSTGVILLVFSNISGFVIPADAQKLKEDMKKHIDILLEPFYDDSDLIRILPDVALQVVKDVNDYLGSRGKAALPESTVKTLMDQIPEMEDPNHRIRDLVQRRVLEFNKQAISTARSAPLQVPPGLTLCQKELAQVAGAFVRLVAYNRSVFGDFYADIIDNHVLFTEPAERREV